VVEEYMKVRRNASTALNASNSSIGVPGREAYSLLIAEVCSTPLFVAAVSAACLGISLNVAEWMALVG
jgi:hypothetical protein